MGEKYLLVTVLPTNSLVKNIGDYIQTIAVKQFRDDWDGYIDREETNNYKPEDGQKRKVVFNGVIIRDVNNWPPSPYIVPLFTSLHIFPSVADELLTKNVDYFKAHSPIGCRDLGTLKYMQSKGIPSYFSACLTLTLGETYSNKQNSNTIMFVDPILPDINDVVKHKLKAMCRIINIVMTSAPTVVKLYRNKFFKSYSEWGYRDSTGITDRIRTFIYVCMFVSIYSSKFEKKMLRDAHFISNMYRISEGERNNNEALLSVADKY